MKRFYLLLSILVSTSFCFTNLFGQSNSSSNMVGKWLIVDFSYKSAINPEEDYQPSRKDFENMVKFKKTFEITPTAMKEYYGNREMITDFLYQIDADKLYYWNPAEQGGKTKLDETLKNSTKTTVYKVKIEKGKMTWIFSNSAYILKLTLAKQ